MASVQAELHHNSEALERAIADAEGRLAEELNRGLARLSTEASAAIEPPSSVTSILAPLRSDVRALEEQMREITAAVATLKRRRPTSPAKTENVRPTKAAVKRASVKKEPTKVAKTATTRRKATTAAALDSSGSGISRKATARDDPARAPSPVKGPKPAKPRARSVQSRAAAPGR
jgi:peptidoglycan hydrolase CwlO-like protein